MFKKLNMAAGLLAAMQQLNADLDLLLVYYFVLLV
jgi:hypothetical protein